MAFKTSVGFKNPSPYIKCKVTNVMSKLKVIICISKGGDRFPLNIKLLLELSETCLTDH